VGDDVNPCSRTAPCKTFAGAISKTAVNGEINCLDPGGFGGVTITKSITIDCHEVYASVLVAGTNGVTIAFDSFAGTDVRKTVRLRNLNFNGSDTGLRGISITGATNTLNSEVHIEDCMVDGFQGSPGNGISDTRVNSGKLFVNNTTIRNNSGVGITINPASGSQVIQASINNVRSLNNNFGLTAGSGTRVMITNSTFAGNNAAGVEAESPAGGTTEVDIDNSTMSGNNIGVQNGGGTTTIRSSNSNIAFNNTAFVGATSSFGNNRVSGAIGTAPGFIGSPTTDHGQN
jgi:hypothetical protein